MTPQFASLSSSTKIPPPRTRFQKWQINFQDAYPPAPPNMNLHITSSPSHHITTTHHNMDLIPGKLRYLCIYNPTLGTTQKELHKQILYYHSEDGPVSVNEQLREIGLAQGMVEFSKELSGGEKLTHVTSKKTRTLVVNLEGDIWAALCVHLPVEVRNGAVVEYNMKGLSGVEVMIGELRRCWDRWVLFSGGEHDASHVSHVSHVTETTRADLSSHVNDTIKTDQPSHVKRPSAKSALRNEVTVESRDEETMEESRDEETTNGESRDTDESTNGKSCDLEEGASADQSNVESGEEDVEDDIAESVDKDSAESAEIGERTNGSHDQSRDDPDAASRDNEPEEPEEGNEVNGQESGSRDEENDNNPQSAESRDQSNDQPAESRDRESDVTPDLTKSHDDLSSSRDTTSPSRDSTQSSSRAAFFNAFSSCWNPNLHSRGILDSIPYTEIDRIKLSEDTTQVIEAVLSKDPNLVHCSIARGESRDTTPRAQGHSKIVYSSSPCFPLSCWLLECCDIGDEMAFAEESGFVSHVSIRKSRAQLADYASENPSPSPTTYISKLGTLMTQTTVSTLTSWNPWKQHFPNSEEAIAPEDDVEDGKFVVRARVTCTQQYGKTYLVVYQRAPLTFALLYKSTEDLVYPSLNLKLAALVEPVVRDIERGLGNPHYPKLLASPDPFYYIVVDPKNQTLTTNLRHVPFDTEVVNFVNPNPDPHNSEIAHVHTQFGRLMSQQEAFLGHEKLARSNQNWWFYWTRLPDQRQVYMARKWLKSKPSADGHSVVNAMGKSAKLWLDGYVRAHVT